jgi:hypothetical protein
VYRHVAEKVDRGHLRALYNRGPVPPKEASKDMRPLQWVTSLFAPFRRASEPPRAETVEPLSEGLESSPVHHLDVAEEFQHVFTPPALSRGVSSRNCLVWQARCRGGTSIRSWLRIAH